MNEMDDPTIWEGFAGPPTPMPQARANALRTKPTRTSTSVSPTVGADVPVTPAQPQPMNAAQTRSMLGQQAMGDITAAEKEIERYTGPQDYTAMQDYAKQRTSQGQHSLLLALAAQTAGKEFEPIGGAYLKQAMEARTPLKTATGIIDDMGQHIEDPQAKAEQRLKLAQARMAKAQQVLQSNATAEEKAAAQAEANAMRREAMQQTAALRQMTASIAQGNQQNQQSDRIFRGEDRMKNDFEQVTKSPREGLAATQQVKPLIATAGTRALNNVEQQALITLFNKFLDPTSVVREGEFNRMAQGMGLGNQVANWQDKILRGSIITPQMVNDIARVANLYEKDATARIQQQAAEYENVARTRGYSPEAVITNPNFRTVQTQQGAPAGAVRAKGAPTAAPVASPDAPPPGAVRVKGAR